MPTALVRKPSPAFSNALSSHPLKHCIDHPLACLQHQHYVDALKKTGVQVVALEALENYPDSPFVEDTAVIFRDVALICAMKEKNRQGETPFIAEALKNHRPIRFLEPPATLDGGDVLMTDAGLFVGQSTRSNLEAVKVLDTFYGKPCTPVPVKRGLHLKSAVSYLGENQLLIDLESVDSSPFKNFDWILVAEKDRYAANCLTLGKSVILPAGFPEVASAIRDRGFQVTEVEMSEFEKADGGVTCLSLLLPD